MIQFQTCYKKNPPALFCTDIWTSALLLGPQTDMAWCKKSELLLTGEALESQLDKLVWLTGSIIRLLSSRAHSPPKKETLQTCSKQMEMWSELIGNNLHFIFNTNHDLPAQIKHHTGLFEISTYQSYDKQVLMHILSPNTFLLMTSTTLFRLFTLPWKYSVSSELQGCFRHALCHKWCGWKVK